MYCLLAHTKAACKCVVHVNAQIHDDALHVNEYVKTQCVCNNNENTWCM